MNTNWTTPKRNIILVIWDLRSALAAGMNARLIRARNEDCAYPISVKNSITDFRAYEFSVGLMKTRNQIADDPRTEPFLKHLSLNYKNCYGTQEAVDRYYETGKLSMDNFKMQGRSHLVNVKDMVVFLTLMNDDRGKMFKEMYIDDDKANERHFYDHYRLKREHSPYTIKRFKRKVWVTELLKADQKIKLSWLMFTLIGLLNGMCYPLKFISRRHVLQMKKYKIITFRVGDVINGFAIEIHIPKKFGFR